MGWPYFFFFNDTATTEIYTLSLHDALPISSSPSSRTARTQVRWFSPTWSTSTRSEEHTSELQSHVNLVCRLLLEKKNLNESKPYHHPTQVASLAELKTAIFMTTYANDHSTA